MADGFYTNDDEGEEGCFGGYGSDGAWADADSARGSCAAAQPLIAATTEPGAFTSMSSRQRRFMAVFRASGSGDSGQAA